MWKKRFYAMALALVLLLSLAGCGATTVTTVTQDSSEITVSASATVRLVPDKASVSFGVSTQAQTAEQAQQDNTEAVNHVIEVLKESGVAEKSIRTTYYSMYPQYDYNYYDSDTGEQRVIGYSISTTMSVQDQNVEDLGKLLSACVSAGASNVDSVQFFCSGYDEAYQQALSQAVADSKDEAQALAAAAGKELGEVVSIIEGWQDTYSRYNNDAGMSISMADKEEGAGAGDMDFQPGESEVTANVTVTYRMK